MVVQVKEKLQELLFENRILEGYKRGEYFRSMDEAISAYRFQLESKKRRKDELGQVIEQLEKEKE